MNRKHKIATLIAFALSFYVSGFTAAGAGELTGASVPEPVPLTRNDIKRALDASKESSPRLPRALWPRVDRMCQGRKPQ